MAQGAMTSSIFQGVGAIQEGKANYVAMEAGDNASRVAYGDAMLQVKQVELAAAQREADRKEALAQALASQNAMAGAKGITTGGSVFDVMQEDTRQMEEAQRRDRFMTDLEKRSTAYRAILQRRFDRQNKRLQGFSAFHSTVSQVGGAAGGAASSFESPKVG